AGTGSVTVTTGAGCTWAASSGAAWIPTPASGTGSGNAAYSVAANATTSARSGTLTIAGQTYTVTQDAPPCSYALSPTSASIVAAGGTGTLTVTAGSTCTWTPSSSAGWLTCTPANGTGGGTVTYTVAANTSTA